MRFIFWALLILLLIWCFVRFRRFLRGISATIYRQYQERAGFQETRQEKDISDRVRIIDEKSYDEQQDDKEHNKERSKERNKERNKEQYDENSATGNQEEQNRPAG